LTQPTDFPLLSPPRASRLPGAADSAAKATQRDSVLHASAEKNPGQLIRETLALEREIVTGLEKLLKEVEE
jgi:hypothetical protein